MPVATSCPGSAEVHVWYADATAFGADRTLVARALEWLNAEERRRYDRFRHEDDRLMFALGRVMSRTLVGRALGVDPDSWRWREGEHGRPEIAAPDTPLRFNLAHSAGLVVCALAYGREVGVDVENTTRPAPDPLIVRRYCSPIEAEDVEARGPHWRDRFLVYWTLKEAYLKALGLGISVSLADISFLIGPDEIRVAFLQSLKGTDTRWAFDLLHPDSSHLVAVASSTADGVRPALTVRPF